MIGILNRKTPHIVIPGMLTPVVQDVPFEKALGDITSYGEEGVTTAYKNTVPMIQANSVVANQYQIADAVNFQNDQIEVPYLNISSRVAYNEKDVKSFEKLGSGVALDEFLTMLARMATFQRLHFAALFGFDSTANQGIARMGVAATLPADSEGATTVTAYKTSELVQFLASIARQIMTNSYATAKPVVLMSSTRMVNYIKTAIITLGEYQMPGGGVDSVGGAYSRIVGEWLGVGQIDFVADDLLNGAGAGGADLVLFVAPGLDEAELANTSRFDQAELNKLPGNGKNTYMDIVAGGAVEYTNPVIDRQVSKNIELLATPGVVWREDAVLTLTASYE